VRGSVRAAGAAILIGGPTALAFYSGGFFDRPRLVAGIAAWVLVAVAAAVAERPLPASRSGRLALAGLVALCAWTALSYAWAPLGERVQDDAERLMLYAGYFAAAVALLRGPVVRAALEPLLALGALIVVGYGLSERLFPGLVELDRSRTAAGRLEQPLTYWNALGALAAIGLVIAIRVAGDQARGRAVRAAAAAGGVPLVLGVYLSFSRGALAALAAGVLVLLALAPAGRAQVRAAISVLACGGLASLVATALPTVQSLELGKRGDPGDGLVMFGALLVLSAAAAAAVLAPARGTGRREALLARMVLPRRSALVAVTAAALLAAVLAAAALEGRPEAISPKEGANPARLRSIDTNRYRYWDVALDSFAKHPVAGVGSGGFFVEWRRQRDRVDQTGEAHSLYIETLAELGLVGFGLLALFLGGVAASGRRLHQRAPAAATGLAAGFVAWAVHAGLDWDWEMPAVTLVALALAASMVALADEYPSSDAASEAAHASPREREAAAAT
jgi:O-Antigen ligase